MKKRTMHAALAALTLMLACCPAAAQVLYATSVRTFASGGSDKVVGSMYTINLANATATLVAPIRLRGESAVGIAIDDRGTAYVTPAGAAGLLDKVDTRTGVLTPGPSLTGAPFPSGISAMTFTPSGLLLALNSNVGSPASVRL